jgi:hypothetical protein
MMSSMVTGLVVGAALFAQDFQADPIPYPQPRVLVIGVDGLRPDALEAANTPHIDGLIATGSYSPNAQCEDLTFSGPNWASILHGVHRDKHNVTTNGYGGNNLAFYPDFLALLEAHDSGWNTVRLSTWSAIFQHQPTGADIDLFRDYVNNGDNVVTEWAADLLRGEHASYPGVRADALFLYLADVDVVGHTYGFHPAVPEYVAEIESVDGQIGLVLSAVRDRMRTVREDWVCVLTSDHGGSIDGGHSGNSLERRTIPFLASTVRPEQAGKLAFRPRPQFESGTPFPEPKNVDVTKTVLRHMGASIPAWLDGHAVGLRPTSPPPVVYAQSLIFNGDAEFDRGFDNFLPDQAVSGWIDPGPDQMSLVRWGAPDGFPTHSDPGPPQRGANFFCGNRPSGSWMGQEIDVSTLTTDIDAAGVRYVLSAFLGGFAAQNDRALVTVLFLGADGALLGADTIGPVTAADRGNATGLHLRTSAGFGVPVGTRRLWVAIETIYAEGAGTDGYADDVSFVLQPGNLPPPPLPSTQTPTPQTSEWRFSGDSNEVINKVFGPGTMEYADGDGGATDMDDVFGISDGLGVPHIDGSPVSYLRFQARSAATEGYHVRANTATGGSLAQFTMIFDLYVEASNDDPWLGLWNGSPTNTDDDELFLRPISTGYWVTDFGTLGGTWEKGRWNRFVFVNDFAAGSARLYVNGNVVPEFIVAATDDVPDGTTDPFWFLTDNTPSETSEGCIANFALVDALLDPATIAALGGADANGIFP